MTEFCQRFTPGGSLLYIGDADTKWASFDEEAFRELGLSVGAHGKMPDVAGTDYFRRTGIFPIMHVTGVRRALVDEHPWLPAAVLKAFTQAKAKCLEELEDTATSKCTLPFVDEQLKAARELMGEDFWSYGLAANRKVLETFLRHHHAEGLSPRLLTPEEMFHPSTHATFTI